jgi:hypothetical protein
VLQHDRDLGGIGSDVENFLADTRLGKGISLFALRRSARVTLSKNARKGP